MTNNRPTKQDLTKTINLFFDMDGVLAEYDKDTVTKMYDEGFFLERPPVESMLRLVKELLHDTRYNIYILSSMLADSDYCVSEKHEWLDSYLPELPRDRRFFVMNDEPKDVYIKRMLPDFETSTNILFDDYSYNLWRWIDAGFTGVKVLNGVNNSNKTWTSYFPLHSINTKTPMDQCVLSVQRLLSLT